MDEEIPSLKQTANAPENRSLEKEIPIVNHHSWGRAVSFREGSTLAFFGRGCCKEGTGFPGSSIGAQTMANAKGYGSLSLGLISSFRFGQKYQTKLHQNDLNLWISYGTSKKI